jgi:hypothetical protein
MIGTFDDSMAEFKTGLCMLAKQRALMNKKAKKE